MPGVFGRRPPSRNITTRLLIPNNCLAWTTLHSHSCRRENPWPWIAEQPGGGLPHRPLRIRHINVAQTQQ
ncbi:MAG: hypothetical protein ACK6DR_14380 [Gemmatimonas sp.]|uniref:hypothetical protein n=1 Tax=Gemmatimonas sp. TaxID=1962908 RepID=UPI00391F329A